MLGHPLCVSFPALWRSWGAVLQAGFRAAGIPAASPARGSARSEGKVLIHPERLWMDGQRAGACPGSLCGGELLEQMVGIPRVRGWPAPGRCWLCAGGRRMGAAACRLTQTHRRLCWNWLDYSTIQRAHPINFLGFFYSSLILTRKTLSVEQIYT